MKSLNPEEAYASTFLMTQDPVQVREYLSARIARFLAPKQADTSTISEEELLKIGWTPKPRELLIWRLKNRLLDLPGYTTLVKDLTLLATISGRIQT